MLRSHFRPPLRLAAAGLALCAGLATAGTALAATGAPAGTAAGSGSSTFIVGDTSAPDSANPYIGQTTVDFEEVTGLVYDSLMDYGQADFSPSPRLATSWSVSKNKLVWTYQIRHGVKWSDGVPLTAADVAYTFSRDTIPNTVEQANNSAYLANVVHNSIKATGPYTVQMTVTTPTPTMDLLIVPILPKHIWEHISEAQVKTFPNTNPVGSGPFIMTSFKINQNVTLRANPHYWGGKPGISNLIFKFYTNANSEATDLKSGAIDFAESLTTSLFNGLRGVRGVTLDNAPSGNWDELAFNNGAATISGKKIGNGNPALLDINVRHAISYAINRQVLVQRVLSGYAIPGSSVIPPLYPQFHYTPPASSAYTFDPAKASQILTADGWKVGPGGWRVKNGKVLSLRLSYPSDSATYASDAQYIKPWLQAIGIQVNVTALSGTVLSQDIANGDYDTFIWGWGTEPNPDFQLSIFTCAQRSSGSAPNYTAGWSDNFYCNSTYDKLYAEQKTVGGQARANVVQQMQKMLYADDPYSVLYYWNDTQAYRSDKFTGFAPSPDKPNGLLLFQEVAYWSYRCIRPVGSSPSLTDTNIGCQHELGAPANVTVGASSSGLSGGLLGGIAGAAALAAVAGLFLARRRKVATADERE